MEILARIASLIKSGVYRLSLLASACLAFSIQLSVFSADLPSPISTDKSESVDSSAQPEGDTSVNVQNSDSEQTEPVSDLSRLQSLEERLFNTVFSIDSNSDRLLRLEKFVFGIEGKGDFKTRLDKLNKVFAKSMSNANLETNQTASITKVVEDKPKGLLAIINHGIDNYNRHRYHNAEDDFNDALDLAPGMSRVHVYLGVTLLQLNQRQAAIDAMRAAYEIDPFGTYGRYAKHCLITLMGDEEVRKRGPKDNLKTVQSTLDTVNRNADKDAQRHGALGNTLAQARSLSASNYVNRMTDYSNYTNEMGLRSNYIRSDAMVQAARARQDAAQRAAYTQESANNLKSLITTKLLPGDAKLRAFGTSLHARYYGDETYNLAPWYIPRETPLELKAKALTLKALPTAKGRSKAKQQKVRSNVPSRKNASKNTLRKSSSSKKAVTSSKATGNRTGKTTARRRGK